MQLESIASVPVPSNWNLVVHRLREHRESDHWENLGRLIRVGFFDIYRLVCIYAISNGSYSMLHFFPMSHSIVRQDHLVVRRALGPVSWTHMTINGELGSRYFMSSKSISSGFLPIVWVAYTYSRQPLSYPLRAPILKRKIFPYASWAYPSCLSIMIS